MLPFVFRTRFRHVMGGKSATVQLERLVMKGLVLTFLECSYYVCEEQIAKRVRLCCTKTCIINLRGFARLQKFVFGLRLFI